MNATVHMIALFLSTLVYLSSAGCGSRDDTKPQLRVTIADVKNAGTDDAGDMYARVLYGRSIRSAAWTDWQDLNTGGCDDLDRDQTDYFDLELGGSTERWIAIAFYATTIDGMLVDSLGVWNGSAPVEVNQFCSLIAGPSRGDGCFENADTGSDLCSNPVTDDPSYDSFWVDKDDCFVSINLVTNRNGARPGTEFYQSDPGTPSNPSSYNVNKELVVSSFQSFGQVAVIGASHWIKNTLAIAVISVIMFVCQWYYFKRKYADYGYKQIVNEV